MKTPRGWRQVAVLACGLVGAALFATACGPEGVEATGVATVEGAQVLVLADETGTLYDLEYVGAVSPEELAATVEVGGIDEQGLELPALKPVVERAVTLDEVVAPETLGIIGLRPHRGAFEGEAGKVQGAVTVNGLSGTWVSFSGSIWTSGAYSSTCHSITNMIGAVAVLPSPSTADFDLYLYGNTTCSGSSIGSATSGTKGMIDMIRWASGSNWSSNPRKTVGFKVKSASGTGSYSLKVAYYNFF